VQLLNIMPAKPQVITSNFERRGWQEVHEEGDESWNIFWANVGTVRQVFSSDSLQQLRPDQLINHFPNHYELTRKVMARAACSCVE
jgi:tubulin polyglutamylase TTLL1